MKFKAHNNSNIEDTQPNVLGSRLDDTAEIPVIAIEKSPQEKTVLEIKQLGRTKKRKTDSNRGVVILTSMVAFAFLLALALIFSALNAGASTGDLVNPNSETTNNSENFSQDEEVIEAEEDGIVLKILDQFPAFRTSRDIAEELGIDEEELTRRLINDSDGVIKELNKGRQGLDKTVEGLDKTVEEITDAVEDFDPGELVEDIPIDKIDSDKIVDEFNNITDGILN